MPSTQPGEWTFAASDEGPTAKVYGLQEQATYVFDPAQGLVIRSEARTAQAGARPTTRQTTRLVSRQAKDANWVLEFDRQADVYFQAIDAYDQAFADLQPGTAKVEPALAGAAANLQAAAQKLTVPMLLEPIQARLAEHATAVQSARQDLQQRARMIRKPAGDWTLTDFAGQTHMLKDYHGKVVVMDFWYRGCVWCIRAMPQIQQLAEDFAGKPVAILGMNTDADPADARFVIDTLGLNYTNLQAAALPERYGIQMFPTLLVLDGQGIIRDVRMGFEPNLRQALGRTIEALLAEPRPAATQPAP